MLRYQTICIPALLVLLGATSATAAPGEWRLVLQRDGVEVHRREVPGSRLLEFRGRGQIEAPLSQLLAILRDVPRRTEWTERCVAAQLVEEVNPRIQISYNRTSAPWPVADRDVVLRGETTIDVAARQVRVDFHSVDDPRMPPRKGIVRMPKLYGHWYFTPVRGGTATLAEYQIQADPGGALPVWLSNLVARQLPLQTILGMRRQAQRRHYPEFDAWVRTQPEYEGFTTSRKGPIEAAQGQVRP